MRHRLIHIVCALGLLALLDAHALAAQGTEPDAAALRIDPAIISVAIDGSWEQGEVSGYYRVIVLGEGSEPARHRVFVQWVEVFNTPDGAPHVRATRELLPPSLKFAVSFPKFSPSGKGWVVTLRVQDSPNTGFSSLVRYSVGPPGVVRRLPGH